VHLKAVSRRGWWRSSCIQANEQASSMLAPLEFTHPAITRRSRVAHSA